MPLDPSEVGDASGGDEIQPGELGRDLPLQRQLAGPRLGVRPDRRPPESDEAKLVFAFDWEGEAVLE
jgi:hypothetical protein